MHKGAHPLAAESTSLGVCAGDLAVEPVVGTSVRDTGKTLRSSMYFRRHPVKVSDLTTVSKAVQPENATEHCPGGALLD